jgi:L-cystine transport system permease protein
MRPFAVGYVWQAFRLLVPFTGVTLGVTLLSVLAGSLFGALLAWGRMSRFAPARAAASLYVHIIRCTPSIVLIFIVFYGFPKLFQLFTGVRSGYGGKLFYVVTALSLLSAASMCELMRSACCSVDRGQTEAAFCCGMSKLQTAWFIVIPQAAAAAIPNFCSETVSLLKQGALAFTIGFVDLMGEATIIVGRSYGAHGLETWLALGGMYWLITVAVEQIFGILERRFSRGKSQVGQEAQWN